MVSTVAYILRGKGGHFSTQLEERIKLFVKIKNYTSANMPLANQRFF